MERYTHSRSLTFAFMLFCFSIFGQEQTIHLNRLSVTNGLTSESYNYFIHKDSSGFVWISSINGLNRYDGKEVYQYISDLKEEGALKENNIQGLFFEDHKNDLWFSTVGGIYCYKRLLNKFEKRTLRDQNNLPTLKGYRLFYLDRERQELWVAAEGIWAILPIDSTREMTVLGDFYINLNARVLRLRSDSSYCLFRPLPQSAGLGLEVRHYSPTPGDWKKFSPISLLPGAEVNAIFPEEKEEKVWIATDRGLYVFNPLDRKLYDILSLQGQAITDISDAGNGQLAIVVAKQKLFFVDKLTRSLNKVTLTEGQEEPLVFQEEINKIYCDSDRVLWISTRNNGVYFANFDNQKFRSIFNRLENTVNNQKTNIKSIAEDSHEQIWFLTDEGLEIVDSKMEVLSPLKLKTILSGMTTYCLSTGINKTPMIGTNQGLYQVVEQPRAQGNFVLQKVDASFRDPITFIAELSNGRTLLSSPISGMLELKSDGRIAPLPEMRAHQGEFNWIFEDSQNNVYLYEVDKGIHRLKIAGDQLVYFGLALFNPQITGVQEDFVDGVLWVSTFSGLFTIKTLDSLQIQKKPTPSQALSGLLLDQKRNLWISTLNGLAQYKIEEQAWVNHNLTDGLQGLGFNFGASLKAKNGRFFFGGKNGANYFNPDKIQTVNPRIRPLLTKILINDELPDHPITCRKTGANNISNIERLVLPHDENTLSFYFAALEYSDPKANQFRYQLIHHDQKMVEGGTKNFIRYANIPPGHYTFRLEASAADGEWNNSTPTQLELTILSPLYSRWWAFVLYSLVLLLIGIFGYRFQLKKRFAIQESKRLQELNHFKNKIYANITHEFRTPLAVIKGLSEKMKNATSKDKKKQEDLSIILRNTKQLQLLVDQMLDLSKIDAGMMNIDLVQGNIVAFLKTRMEMYYTLALAKDIKLHLVFPEETILMDYDPDKIGKVLSNLLSNAIKFTPPGGHIYLQYSTKNQSGQQCFQLRVKDTGIGIAKQDLPQIFDRYYQVNDALNRDYEGTGIGLSLVKELVELMGGQISVESQFEQGTLFLVELPISNTAPMVVAPAFGASTNRPVFSSALLRFERNLPSAISESDLPVVLIAEDNEDFLQLLASYFSVGFTVLLAKDGLEAKALAFKHLPDIVITDIMMPGIDGYELCTILKQDLQTQHIPIIMLTAKGDLDSKIFGLKKGADDYLPKLFEAEELVTRAQNLIRIRHVLFDRSSITKILKGFKRTRSDADQKFITQFIDVVLKHLDDENLRIPFIHRQLHCSKSHLSTKVKELTGLTPAIFIRSIRLKKAKELIQDPNLHMTLKQVAHKVGFVDYSHFSDCYKKEFNYTPKETPRRLP